MPNSAPPAHIQVGGVIAFEIAIHDGRAANARANGSGERIENLK